MKSERGERMFRIGQSSDIHRLTEGRRLVLGGVDIAHEKGLLGHSDADALVHAVAEAVLGALGLGDLGRHFPDTDPRFEGVSSLTLLSQTAQMMRQGGYRIGNVDALIMIERPKMAPYIAQMKNNLAQVLDCDPQQINVKATRGEGLGFVGREEGVLAQAVVLLEKTEEQG